jgi:leucyl-tRNA synthetase
LLHASRSAAAPLAAFPPSPLYHPNSYDKYTPPFLQLQYALQTGTHPAVTTARNVARFRQQLKALGFSYDWSRELSTTDPDYYK